MKNKKISEHLQVIAIILMIISSLTLVHGGIKPSLLLSISANLFYYLSIQKAY